MGEAMQYVPKTGDTSFVERSLTMMAMAIIGIWKMRKKKIYKMRIEE